MKPILVGESNPLSSDPADALVPYPDGCAGHRLAVSIFGMSRKAYMDSFDRINLCMGDWSQFPARLTAAALKIKYDRIVLLGSRVASAFGLNFEPFTFAQGSSIKMLILPHPSGLSRLWNNPNNIKLCRELIKSMCPELELSDDKD